MPITNYPFKVVGDMARPMLPVRIINPETGRAVSVWGLIDTGADDCSIPGALAERLGHNFVVGEAKSIETAGGTTQAYGHTTRIDILSINDHVTVVHTIPDTPVDFCEGLGIVLLGVKNFLSNFTLHIDYPNQRFSIKRP